MILIVLYSFIAGKNYELSKAELIFYLDSREYDYKIIETINEVTIIEFLNEIDVSKVMDDLGGSIKIAKVICEIPAKYVERAFKKKYKKERERIVSFLERNVDVKSVFGGLKKVLFGASIYDRDKDFIFARDVFSFMNNFFKDKLKQNGIKARFMGLPKDRKESQLTHVEVIKKGLVEIGAEIVFCEGAESWYLCHTRAVHNPFEFQKRDVERPYQRPIFSISPRLSKILVNLSGAKPNDILLDTFCGYGTILQEAILMGMDIRGIDIDEKCVEATKKNLKWLSKEYNIKINDVDDKIFLGDAKKLDQYFEENSIDAIATEPPLGPPLKKLPPTKIAERIIKDLETLYYSSFQSFYKVLKPNKRISIVLPCIKTSTGKFVKFDPIELTREIGFGAVPLSREHTTLIDAEMRHRVLREIYVFKKF